MTDFNTLIDHHEMGQAYVRITAQDGPSRQLLAFINYDAIQKDGIGLESFDADSLHQLALSEIEADPSFDLALEALSSDIATHVNRADDAVGMEGFIAKLFGKSTPPYALFRFWKSHQDGMMELTTTVLTHMPSDFSLKAWDQYVESKALPAYTKVGKVYNELSEEAALTSRESSDKSFDDSGWNRENYKAAKTWADGERKKMEALIATHKAKMASVDDWVKTKAKTAPDGKAIARLISESIGKAEYVERNAFAVITQAEAILLKVATHFKED